MAQAAASGNDEGAEPFQPARDSPVVHFAFRNKRNFPAIQKADKTPSARWIVADN
jgi:hypothetical protein